MLGVSEFQEPEEDDLDSNILKQGIGRTRLGVRAVMLRSRDL